MKIEHPDDLRSGVVYQVKFPRSGALISLQGEFVKMESEVISDGKGRTVILWLWFSCGDLGEPREAIPIDWNNDVYITTMMRKEEQHED